MLLQLIPAHPEPTIHFTFDFSDLPQSLNTPPSWSNQLSHLIVEDLEVPNTVHSFDKAAGITSLLEEVAFDVERGEVRCRFVDGATEEWGFFRFAGNEADIGAESGFEAGQKEGRKLVAALDGIVRDVRASTQEVERLIMEKDKERQKIQGLERSKSWTVKGNGKMKHKKQRSVFMQFVSSLGSTIANLTSPSSSGGISLSFQRGSTSLSIMPSQHPESLSQASSPHNAETSPRARALRRAARATLVDTYRRFVLTELVRRLPAFSYHHDSSGKYTGVHGGGFCVWILQSMRRRAQERIDQIIEEAEIVMAERAKEMAISVPESTAQVDDPEAVEWLSGQQIHLQPEGQELKKVPDELETTTMVVPLTFNDDETQTETDGSSVRTPSTGSHVSYFPVRPATSLSCHSQTSSTSQTFAESANQFQVPSKDPEVLTSRSSSPTSPLSPSSSTSPTPPNSTRPTSSTLSQDLAGSALQEYNHLTDLRERLWQLAMFAESQTRIAAEEVQNRLEILAVRSRRRAWSAGAFNNNSATQCKAATKGENGLNVAGWQSQYGFAMPFTSSPLARFSWTAEDLKKELEKDRDVDAICNSSSSLGGGVISVAGFPQSRSDESGGVDSDETDDPRPLVEREFELYEEFPGPSPLDLRGGRGRRRRRKELGLGGVGRLFPVSEELEGEGEEAVDLEFRVALGGAGVLSYAASRNQRRERSGRTFMGCDDVDVEEQGQKIVDDDDDFVDPRELDIELGFGFDFHQKGTGGGFLGDTDEENLFDLVEDDEDEDDEDDEDEFKFDLSAQLERPKIRPRIRTSSILVPRDMGQFSKPRTMIPMGSSILCQPIVNFTSPTSSSPNLPLYATLSKSAPSALPPRPTSSSQVHHVSQHPVVLDISRTPTPTIYCEPEVAAAEIGVATEYDDVPFPYVNPHRHHRRLHHHHHHHSKSSSEDGSASSVSVGIIKPSMLGALPPPLPIPLPLGIHDETQEEFTLSMDLPRAVVGGGGAGGGSSILGGYNGGSPGKRVKSAPGRSLLKLYNYSHADGTLVPSC